MNQHFVQEAYLKAFEAPGGRIYVFQKKDGFRFFMPARRCAAEQDFQSEVLEASQHRKVETPAAPVLKALADGKAVPLDAKVKIARWLSLHNVRNKKIRDTANEELGPGGYEATYNKHIEYEERLCSTFVFGQVYSLPAGDEPLITSDNPVLDFCAEGRMCRVLPLSPSRFLFLSRRQPGRITHDTMSLGQMINGMTWANAYERVFSSVGDVNITELKRRISQDELLTREEHMERHGSLFSDLVL